MGISNAMEKLGKAIFESPFGANSLAKDAPELAEIRLAVLDAVKAKSRRASGKNVFPYNSVKVLLRGIPEAQKDVMQSEFLSSYLTDEVKAALTRSSYRFPENLTLEIVTNSALPVNGEEWLEVHPEIEATEQEDVPVGLNAKLIVVQGTANRSELPLDKARINIGRTAQVYRNAGPSRQNDLAFSEDNETNRTVSREHAHVLRSKNGEFRLVNDRSYKGEDNCGIWIVRNGLSQPVHRSTRGTLLKSGDEVHLGKAILRFEREN